LPELQERSVPPEPLGLQGRQEQPEPPAGLEELGELE